VAFFAASNFLKTPGLFFPLIILFILALRNFLIVAVLAGLAAPVAEAQDAGKGAPAPLGLPRKRYLFAQKDPECPVVSNITKNTDEDAEVTGTYTHVCYRSPADLLVEINELRKIHSWADTTYQRRLAALPPGGALVLTIHRKGAKNADPAYLYLTARTKEGKEIYAATPTAGTGRFFGRDLYQSTQAVPFVKIDAISGPVTLIINDTRLRQLFEYTLNIQ
jgi:hypothetical protein